LAAIWREVLAVDAVGINDRFLDLGGDSLRATQILARVIDQFGVEIEHRVLLLTPTIAAMALAILQQQVGQLDAAALEQMLSELERAPAASK
jgi:acyl carrier protein